MCPFLYHCLIPFEWNSYSKEIKKLFSIRGTICQYLNEERWTFPYCLDCYPQNELLYYWIRLFDYYYWEQKSNFTANDFRCVWLSCALLQNILAYSGTLEFRATFGQGLVCYSHRARESAETLRLVSRTVTLKRKWSEREHSELFRPALYFPWTDLKTFVFH